MILNDNSLYWYEAKEKWKRTDKLVKCYYLKDLNLFPNSFHLRMDYKYKIFSLTVFLCEFSNSKMFYLPCRPLWFPSAFLGEC
jgi:hypothetical protein